MELERPIWKRSRNTDTRKGALMCGSSKQGNAFRAPFGPKTVAANNLKTDNQKIAETVWVHIRI